MGTGRKRLKGAAALSIVAIAATMGAASVSADDFSVCTCEVQGNPGRLNAFLKIAENSGQAFSKISENGAFLKFSWGRQFHK